MIDNERMVRKEVKEEYDRRVCERLNKARMTVKEGTGVNDMLSVLKDVMIAVAVEVVG